MAVYVAKGRSEIRWGEKLEFAADVGPGDVVYFAPYVPHQERNLDASETVDFLVVRSDKERIASSSILRPSNDRKRSSEADEYDAAREIWGERACKNCQLHLLSRRSEADRGVSRDAQRANVAASAELYDLELAEVIVDAGESGVPRRESSPASRL